MMILNLNTCILDFRSEKSLDPYIYIYVIVKDRNLEITSNTLKNHFQILKLRSNVNSMFDSFRRPDSLVVSNPDCAATGCAFESR